MATEPSGSDESDHRSKYLIGAAAGLATVLVPIVLGYTVSVLGGERSLVSLGLGAASIGVSAFNLLRAWRRRRGLSAEARMIETVHRALDRAAIRSSSERA